MVIDTCMTSACDFLGQGRQRGCAAILEATCASDEAAAGGCGQQPDLRGALHVYFGARACRRLPAGFPALLTGD